jgi:hypothetical protein
MSIFFIYSEKHLALYPLMPLELFTNWSNAASLLLKFWHGMVITNIVVDRARMLTFDRFISGQNTTCRSISNL